MNKDSVDELNALRRDKEILDWIDRFIQIGDSSIFSSSSRWPVEWQDDDTDETMWNHPISIGYQVELEQRGIYRWEELSNGSKGIRPAVETARKRLDEINDQL